MINLCAIIVGVSYFITAVVLFVLNGLLLWAVMTGKEFKSNTFNVIKSICVSCMLQLVPLTIGGVMTAAQSLFHVYLDKILGIMIQSGWYLYVALTLTLAVDRFFIFIRISPSKYTFVVNLFLVLSWIVWLATIIMFCLPGFGYTYAYDHGEKYYSWNYDSSDGSQTLSAIDPYFQGAVFGMAFVIYLIVFGYLIKLRKSSSGDSLSFKVEVRIFAVAIISFTSDVLFVVWSCYVQVSYELFADISHNSAWLVECGLFTILTLTISAKLRKKVRDVVFRRLGASKVVHIQTITEHRSKSTVATAAMSSTPKISIQDSP
ncbi:hypothetical protein QR680_015633 [Steinernema hermaphroditum]|uniref:7TM GPCR serpentine receptor class x (Srx) domain-containing protein n=1 Tax=Steinernema hermaphroditum TaxID=289476 RepID=A0AA39H8H5_9BILA|nr:hypothetical protein QR680_015633 [Steinernema hermaphroditum]